MELWAHQKKALEMSRGAQAFCLFFEMGAGKTATAIHSLRERFNEEKRIKRTIILTPPMVVPQWKDEWARFSKIDPHKVVLLTGTGKKRLKIFQDHKDKGVIFVTNYETLLMKPCLDAFREWRPECVVFDESHLIKNHTSKRSRAAASLTSHRPFVLLLTGTPILNSPLDIFMQLKCAFGGFPVTPGYVIENFFAFRNRYFIDRNAGMPRDRYFPKFEIMTKERDGIDAYGEINEVLSRFSLRVLKADCMDLPGEMSQVIKVGMNTEQERVYKELKTKLVTYIQGGSCVSRLAIVKAIRLLEITSGFLPVEIDSDGSENDAVKVKFKETPKKEALRELLETLTPTSKVLVWAVWKENYEQIKEICESLKIKYVEAHGGISNVGKTEAVERFRDDSETRVFIGHPGSGGVGLNLIGDPKGGKDGCRYSIFYSRTFSLAHYLQARGRNYRGGQSQKVTHYDLVCEGTIDEYVGEKLAGKIEVGEKMLGDLAAAL
jgi:SNF2 family DNA or RNA helicase